MSENRPYVSRMYYRFKGTLRNLHMLNYLFSQYNKIACINNFNLRLCLIYMLISVNLNKAVLYTTFPKFITDFLSAWRSSWDVFLSSIMVWFCILLAIMCSIWNKIKNNVCVTHNCAGFDVTYHWNVDFPSNALKWRNQQSLSLFQVFDVHCNV